MQMVRKALPWLALAGLASGAYWALFWAPPAWDMSDVQRIMYVHLPAIWVGLVLLILNFAAALTYLLRPSWAADALAEASAEVGLVFGGIGTVLGSIWGRPTWGVYWTWDPRLTTVAILLVAYAGYLALRKFIEDPERRAVWSAVVAIISAVDVPIVYFSVRWWRSLHQTQSNTSTIDHDMLKVLLWNTVATVLLAVWMVWTRYRVARANLEREVALPPELPSTDLPASPRASTGT